MSRATLLNPSTSLYKALRSASATVIQPRRAFSPTSWPRGEAIDSILIANRGEIALRVARTCEHHGIRTTTVYTNPDAKSQHAHSSKWAFNLGETAAYLDQDRLLSLAQTHNCQAIHPGYGFLSENASFAQRCAQQGLVFIGPPAKAIQDMGDKARSKAIMERAGVPCVPGYHGHDQAPHVLAREAERIGYPVLIKAVRGGGGKGMRIVQSPLEFSDMLQSAKLESINSFDNDEVLVEKYITAPRHVEVQIFADKFANCVALGERDCSIQRRHQKILEESPAPHLDPQTRKDLWEKARAAALAVDYEGAGTVEFILDNDTGKFYFMEMNTRLQVEHPVTEMVTGLDLVYWQILVAEGRPLPMTQDQVEQAISTRGHAIEARIYAEDPANDFVPDAGKLLHVKLPKQGARLRIDSGFVQGDEISSHYDPMISKLIVQGETRREALRNMVAALEQYEVAGPTTNIEFLKRLCKSSDFVDGLVETGYIRQHADELFPPPLLEDEILATAAIALFLRAPATSSRPLSASSSTSIWSAANLDFQTRTYDFRCADEKPGLGLPPKIYSVRLSQPSPGHFTISIPQSETMQEFSCTASLDQSRSFLTLYLPTSRVDSRIIFPSSTQSTLTTSPIHIFSRGALHRLHPASPAWLAAALGVTERANSLLSPMPCKILRVDVRAGDVVKKDQSLLAIESMKMETVIKSPKDGLAVKRVVHEQGEVVGGGVELVEFEDDGGSTADLISPQQRYQT